MTQAKSTETIIQEIRRKLGLEFPQPLLRPRRSPRRICSRHVKNAARLAQQRSRR